MELIIKSLRRIISSPTPVLIPDANRNSFAMMNVYKTQGKCRNTAMPNRAKMFWHLLFIILEWVHNNTYLRYLQLCIFLADFIEPVLWFSFFFLWSHWTKPQANVIESKTQQLLFECNFSPLKISMLQEFLREESHRTYLNQGRKVVPSAF